MIEYITIFPESVCRQNIDLPEKERKAIAAHIKKYKWITCANPEQLPSTDASANKYIFHEPIYDNLKKNILKEFERYVRLHYLYTNKFMITTSWATRSKPKDVSYYHSHNNCMFSGVYYPEVRKGEKIIFRHKDAMIHQFRCNPKAYNHYNSLDVNISVKSGDVVFFRSHMMHSIPHNLTNKSRYSIAFNFIPTGYIGYGDSALEIHYEEFKTK